MWYGCGNTALPNPSTMRITLARDGTLTFFNGAVDIGQGSSTVLLQIAADALGLPPAAFRMVVGDTDLTADAGKTSASRQTFVSGNAARLAAEDLRRKILALANAGPDAKLRAGRRAAARSPTARPRAPSISHAAVTVCSRADPAIELDGRACVRLRGDVVLEGIGTGTRRPRRSTRTARASPTPPTASPRRWPRWRWTPCSAPPRCVEIVAAHDVGRAINPTLVEGQIHGGIAQGLGMALMEEFIPGRTENLHDYLIPTAGDMPPIKTYLIEDAEPTGPFGAKGVGEPALIATAPAILSAIRHATGVRVTRVPVLPHRLWEALQAGGWP